MADKPGAPGGQQLGWWKQPEVVSATPTSAKHLPWWQGELARRDAGVADVRSEQEGVASDVIISDVGQELEEEARRRASSHAVEQLVEIYAKSHEINARALRSLTVFTVAVAAFAVIQAILLHDPKSLFLFPAAMFELAIVLVFMQQIKRKQQRPVVTLTKDGIEIHSLLQHTGLVRWEEIEEIGAFTVLDRCVGIVPANSEALYSWMPASSAFFLRANTSFCRLFPQRMRKAMAPITLSQSALPMSADDLIARIDKFRRENAV